jgi:hypothetical protein
MSKCMRQHRNMVVGKKMSVVDAAGFQRAFETENRVCVCETAVEPRSESVSHSSKAWR